MATSPADLRPADLRLAANVVMNRAFDFSAAGCETLAENLGRVQAFLNTAANRIEAEKATSSSVFDRFALQGWNDRSVVDLLMSFVDQHADANDLQTFLQGHADSENYLSGELEAFVRVPAGWAGLLDFDLEGYEARDVQKGPAGAVDTDIPYYDDNRTVEQDLPFGQRVRLTLASGQDNYYLEVSSALDDDATGTIVHRLTEDVALYTGGGGFAITFEPLENWKDAEMLQRAGIIYTGRTGPHPTANGQACYRCGSRSGQRDGTCPACTDISGHERPRVLEPDEVNALDPS